MLIITFLSLAYQFLPMTKTKQPGKAYIAKNHMGVFAFDENSKLIDKMLFPHRPEDIADRLVSKAPEEERLARKLRDYEIDRSVGNKGEQALKQQSRELALKFKWAKNSAEYNQILSKVNILLTKEKLKVKKNDRILMQAIGVLDEIDKVINVFIERLREWYGLYYPEGERHTSNHEEFARIVLIGNREDIEDKHLAAMAKKTAGMEFSLEDITQMQAFAKNILDLFNSRKGMEKYINASAKEVVPNTTVIAGPLLAARLLAHAGGLEKMSRMPSSSIQLLGAEKALFRHLKGGGKAPKYGILFSHPYVQQAPPEKKGKVARLVAAKLSLAAKTDFFSKADHGKELADKLEKQVKGVLG
jgi:nucleolar protein 56